MVMVDAAFEGMRVGMGGSKTIRLGTDAKHLTVPTPREEMKDSDQPRAPTEATLPAQ
jgi:hypothetical protein